MPHTPAAPASSPASADGVRPDAARAAARFAALPPAVVRALTPAIPYAMEPGHVDALAGLVAAGEAARYEWSLDLTALGWELLTAERLVERAAGIRCGHCPGRHMRVADVMECAAYDYEPDEGHFCESPSCMVAPGCAAYRYDSAAAGYWGNGEQERERALWALEDARAAGRPFEDIPPPPFTW